MKCLVAAVSPAVRLGGQGMMVLSRCSVVNIQTGGQILQLERIMFVFNFSNRKCVLLWIWSEV